MDAQTRSLGWQTDLIFARFDGEVADRGDHLLVRTPTNLVVLVGQLPAVPASAARG